MDIENGGSPVREKEPVNCSYMSKEALSYFIRICGQNKIIAAWKQSSVCHALKKLGSYPLVLMGGVRLLIKINKF